MEGKLISERKTETPTATESVLVQPIWKFVGRYAVGTVTLSPEIQAVC